MKILENEFKKWGATWTIIKRTEDWAIVRQAWSLGGYNINVCKIKKTNDSLMPNGKTILAQESLPCAEEYGRIAWNFGKDMSAAEKKFEELTRLNS
jgi:hypothetical protein